MPTTIAVNSFEKLKEIGIDPALLDQLKERQCTIQTTPTTLVFAAGSNFRKFNVPWRELSAAAEGRLAFDAVTTLRVGLEQFIRDFLSAKEQHSSAALPTIDEPRSNEGTHDPTLADVIAAVRGADDLPIQTKRDLESAVRKIAGWMGPDGLSHPAHPGAIAERIRQLSPAMVGLTKAAMANVKSRLRRAMKIVGVFVHDGRQTNVLSLEWDSAFAMISERDRRPLSALAHFASAEGQEPGGITDVYMERYQRVISQSAIHRAPKTAFSETCKVWNRLCEALPMWPGKPVTPPSRPAPYVKDERTLPDTLRQQLNDYLRFRTTPSASAPLAGVRGTSPFRAGRRKFIRASTAEGERYKFMQYLSALIAKGFPVEEMTTLKAVINDKLVDEAFIFFHERAGNRMTRQITYIGQVLVNISEHALKDNPLANEIRALMAPARMPAEMSQKVNRLLRQFDDPRNRRAIFNLPTRLMRLAGAADCKVKAARLFEAALAIELQFKSPLRGGNLASLHIDHNFIKLHPGPRSKVHIVIPAESMKGGKPHEVPLDAKVVEVIETFITCYRPHLPGAASRWLFPQRGGSHANSNSFGTRLSKVIRQHTGIEMTTHMFRHFLTEIYHEAVPGDNLTIQLALGHSSPHTAPRFYMRRNATKAVDHFSEKVLQARIEAGLDLPSRGQGGARGRRR
jgi:integrase